MILYKYTHSNFIIYTFFNILLIVHMQWPIGGKQWNGGGGDDEERKLHSWLTNDRSWKEGVHSHIKTKQIGNPEKVTTKKWRVRWHQIRINIKGWFCNLFLLNFCPKDRIYDSYRKQSKNERPCIANRVFLEFSLVINSTKNDKGFWNNCWKLLLKTMKSTMDPSKKNL